MEVIDPVVRSLRACGVPLETEEHRQQLSSLHRAVALGQVDLLGDFRDEVNARGAFGYTPLHIAVLTANLDAVRDLREFGADPNAVDATDDGYAPLHFACRLANLSLVKELLKFPGVDVNLISPRSGAPLHVAARARSAEVVQLLASRPDVDLNTKDAKEQTLAHLLALDMIPTHDADPAIALLEDLAKSAKLDWGAPDSDGRNAVHLAALSGNAAALQLLLARRPDLRDAPDARGSTPLHLSTVSLPSGRVPSCLRVLLQARADAEARDLDGCSAADVVHALLRTRVWRKAEETALIVGAKLLSREADKKDEEARANAAAAALLQEEDAAAPRRARPGAKRRA